MVVALTLLSEIEALLKDVGSYISAVKEVESARDSDDLGWAARMASANGRLDDAHHQLMKWDALLASLREAGAEPPLELRRMDTPENRAFWASVEQAKEDWERIKPEWFRDMETRREPMGLSGYLMNGPTGEATSDPAPPVEKD